MPNHGHKPLELIVAVDTRERKPYRFPHSEVRTLPTGDYSIAGLENQVAIERKTISDAYASLGRNRARFRREMERLQRLEYAAVVIEATLADFLQAPPFTQMHPKAVVNALLAWSVRYGVHVFFAGDRLHGNAVTRVVLEKYWHYNRG